MRLKIGMQFARSLLNNEAWACVARTLFEVLGGTEIRDEEKKVSFCDFLPEASGRGSEDLEGRSTDRRVEAVAILDHDVIVRPAGSCRFGNVVSLSFNDRSEQKVREVFLRLTADLDPGFAGLATVTEWRERTLDDDGRTVAARYVNVQAGPPPLMSYTYLGSYYSVIEEALSHPLVTLHGKGALVDFGSFKEWNSAERSVAAARIVSQVQTRLG